MKPAKEMGLPEEICLCCLTEEMPETFKADAGTTAGRWLVHEKARWMADGDPTWLKDAAASPGTSPDSAASRTPKRPNTGPSSGPRSD